ELVFDYRCVALLGPVLSREVGVVMPRAQQGRTPMISPSLSGPVPPNRYLFRTALTAPVEGAAVAEYAMQRLGLTRFAVLAPTDRYSSDVVAAFTDDVARRGGRIVFTGSYEPDTVDFGKQMKSLKARDLEQEGTMEQLEANPDSPGATPPPPVYLPGFDAVFLPGDGETVGLIAAQLRFHDIALPLLGSSGWNGREVLSSGGRYVEEAIFADGFFPNAQDSVVQQFVTQFRARYREEPDAFAAQAYDAVRLIIQAIKLGGTSGDLVRDELAKVTGYHGVSGVTGFSPEGEALRRLSWIQIRNGRFVPAL
ncbi:MAG: ABC transporter substrate-binding protein, partial [Nitrospiria bacterium]